MINDYPEGGLKVIDIVSFNKSLKAIWVKKYLDMENQGGWKTFLDFELRKYGGIAIFSGNLNKKDTSAIKISDPFIKEVMEICSEVNFEQAVVTEDHFFQSSLWYNSLIRIENKPVFYKERHTKGVTKVKHLMDNNGKFLSLPAFENKNALNARPLAFYGLISVAKLLKRYIPPNTRPPLKYEFFFGRLLENINPNRLVYKKLVTKKGEQPTSSQQKWLENVNITINWDITYQLSFQCTKSTTLTVFSFKFLHRRLSIIIINQIFSLARDWSKRVTWANIPQLKLGNIRDY